MRKLTKYIFVLAMFWKVAVGPVCGSGPIVKLDPSLDEILPAGVTLESLGEGYVFLEGPVWVRSGGYLLYSNMPERIIEKWTPDGKKSVYLNLADSIKADAAEGSLSNGTTLDRQERLVFCSPVSRTIMRVEKDGKFTVLADRYEGKRLNNPNDLVYKSNGSLYFTDNGKPPKAELVNSVYLLKNDKLQRVTDQLESPNGIALSPDEKYLYVNDIAKKVMWRFEVQPDDTLANGRVFVDMTSESAIGGLDGLKVDEKGNIYNSGPGGLWIVSSEGKRLGTILTPDRVSNLTFGDADGKTLYITLHNALYRIRLKIAGVRP